MCTTGTKGLRGCRTSETPVAKNGFPPTSAAVGGRIPSLASSSRGVAFGFGFEFGFEVGVGFEVEVGFEVGVDRDVGVVGGSTAAGYLSPHTAEKLQPPFSNTSPRSSLISPPPPPGRSHFVRLNFPPSSSSRRAQIRSRNP